MEARLLPLTLFVSVADVMRVLFCSRSTAYTHLRRAAGRPQGSHGLLRVSAHHWEKYISEVFSCGSSGEAKPGTGSFTAPPANEYNAAPDATTTTRPKEKSVTGNGAPTLRLTQPRRRP